MSEEKSKSSVAAEQHPIEFSVKSILLSIIVVSLLGASNIFLGLKVGTTIAASIPAVVIAMGIFRIFRKHSLLEINTVQTAAATGEGVTSGIIFTIPALIIMHFWNSFHYWPIVAIGIVGGILGILFSIPLRRVLLDDKTLRFPEGTAIGQVIKASAKEASSLFPITMGGLVGASIGLCQMGFRVLAQGYETWVIRDGSVFGFNLGFSPAVIAAGYICGINVSISLLVGIILGWLIGVPAISHHYGVAAGTSAAAAAQYMWSHYNRYMGVGAMLVGGLWTLVKLFSPVMKGAAASFKVWKSAKAGHHHIVRTEKDIPLGLAFKGSALLGVATFAFLAMMFHPSDFGISNHLFMFIILICAVYTLIAGLIFSSVGGYFAGLVGSTNSPGSGLMVAALLGFSVILLLVLAPHVDFSLHPSRGICMAALATVIVALVGIITIMAGETVQVAKAGDIVGATPWKQQVTLIGSVIVVSLIIPFILRLLYNAYGIGGAFPHPGMSPTQALSAPQAGLIAAVSQGVFNHQIPWPMLGIGVAIAIVGIFVDEGLRIRYGLRLPVLAIGLGMYLPLEVSTPIIMGGIISYLVNRKVHAQHGVVAEGDDAHLHPSLQNAIMLACGIVAGSTLMGVFLAIPFAIKQNTDVLRLVSKDFVQTAGVLSVIVTIGVCYWIYRTGTKKIKSKETLD